MLCGKGSASHRVTLEPQGQLGSSGSLSMGVWWQGAHTGGIWTPVQEALIKWQQLRGPQRMEKFLMTGQRTPQGKPIPIGPRGLNTNVEGEWPAGRGAADMLMGVWEAAVRRSRCPSGLGLRAPLAHLPLDASSHSCLTLYRTWAFGWLSGRWQAITAVFPSSTSITCCTSNLKS